jgi:hypothetical protein
MRKILHILTKPQDDLAEAIIAAHQSQKPNRPVIVFDLTGAEPDYRALLESIFKADSILVW